MRNVNYSHTAKKVRTNTMIANARVAIEARECVEETKNVSFYVLCACVTIASIAYVAILI